MTVIPQTYLPVNGIEYQSDTTSVLLQSIHDRIIQGQVNEGMSDLLPHLLSRRLGSAPEVWARYVDSCLGHPLRQLLHQDPFTFRAFSKPRGYAGDAVLLDFVYGVEEDWPAPEGTSELGKQIFQFTTRSAACEAVRARRGFIADLLDRFVEEVPRPHILSLAAGHLREAELAASVRRRKIGRLVALDSDSDSLKEIQQCYGNCGVEPIRASIRQVLARKVALGDFDLVYSTGLFDYLSQPAGQALTRVMFEFLRPRGRLLVANFLPGIPDLGYMESYMAWTLIYRNREEMVGLLKSIPQAEIREIKIFAEENQNVIFLEVTRN